MKIVTLKDLKRNDDQDDSDENKERYFAGGGKNTYFNPSVFILLTCHL